MTMVNSGLKGLMSQRLAVNFLLSGIPTFCSTLNRFRDEQNQMHRVHGIKIPDEKYKVGKN